jgi:drug/metabolite transporter (DMT)-like permease
MRLVKMLPATIIGISSLTVPVVGVFSGMLMLGEKPGAAEWGALLLILGALAVILLPSGVRRQDPSAPPVIVD